MEISVARKVFILGDSRTGTTTLHKFLKLAGYSSIHYFFKQSGVSEPSHFDFDANWIKLKAFIESGEYEAFSDYPLRSFYRQLFKSYPDAHFILTVRKDVDTWRNSMLSFFSKFNIKINIELLTKSYNSINEDIRKIAASQGAKFCEICIDDDPMQNGILLSNFLDLGEVMSLGWENSTVAYDNSLWSTRVTLFNTTASDFLEYVKRITNPSKAMLSEYGWVFLINDSSDFLDYCYGKKSWSDLQRSKAISTMNARRVELAKKNALYLKFIVPEKSIIYSQYLPKIFAKHEISKDRPAVNLAEACESFVSYPADVLSDARSYGTLYFRGDSHTNWLGAFFLYQHVIEELNSALTKKGLKSVAPFVLADFDASLVSYAGDLFTQLDKEMVGFFQGAWKPINLSTADSPKIEHLVRYLLCSKKRKAVRKDVEDDYLALLGERETFRFSHPNKELPRAVIFRDSTADYLVDVLAEHFSESIFIWHKGYVYSDVIEREKPDVVLHLMAERFVVQYENFPAVTKLGL
jgi:hypothetical protein